MWAWPRVRHRIIPTAARWRRGLQTAFRHPDINIPNLQKVDILSDEGHFLFDLEYVLILRDVSHKLNRVRLWNFDEKKRPRALLLYLPPISFQKSHPGFKLSPRLSRQATGVPYGFDEEFPFPIIRINYRYHGSKQTDSGSTAHDVANAYTIISESFCDEQTKIAIYGKFIGASYALSLSLALNNSSSTSKISAVVLTNGIYDWAAVAGMTDVANSAEICNTTDIGRLFKRIGETLRAVKQMRAQFCNPAHCFHPFASPVLYFRSNCIPIPSRWHNVMRIRDVEWTKNAQGTRLNYLPMQTLPQENTQSPSRTSDGIEVPPVRFYAEPISVWYEPGIEMANLLRKNIMSNSQSLDPWAEAHSRVEYIGYDIITDPIETVLGQQKEWVIAKMEQSLI